MDVSAREELRKVQSGAFFRPGTIPYDVTPPPRRKKLGEGGGGWSKWKLRIEKCVFATANSQLSNQSIMAFELPIIEMPFALSEFEFKAFTFGNRFSNLSSHF